MNLLFLTILFPIIGCILLILFSRYCSETFPVKVGICSIGLNIITNIWIILDFLNIYSLQHKLPIFKQYLYTLIAIEFFSIDVTLYLDKLSLIMISIINIVCILVYCYAYWYFNKKNEYLRFFFYTNFFIASMNLLVLADNMLVMFFGWELVGLCSYLLIGFYYTNLKNNLCAIKVFIITRFGDVLLAIALLILFTSFNTLNFNELIILFPEKISTHNNTITIAIVLIFIGAIAKSAQFPLHTWLIDAMVSPTPVSALMHSATMVISGVYLIVRTQNLFILYPKILYIIGIIGSITLLIASCSALVQINIKKILAYSTISQIGYMFLAIGIQAFDQAIFHLITHAFYKALLFLSSGVVISYCYDEQNILYMRGLRKSMPFIYICFLLGGGALSSFPLFTSGFYSKEEILWQSLINNHIEFMIIGLIGSFLTSLYIFRLIFIVFHNDEKIKINKINISIRNNKILYLYIPLIILSLLSTFIVPKIIYPIDIELFSNITKHLRLLLQLVSSIISIFGIYISTLLWLDNNRILTIISNNFCSRIISNIWFYGWGFDWLYNHIFVKTYLNITNFLYYDPLNLINKIIVYIILQLEQIIKIIHNGKIRWYIAYLSFGAIFIIGILILL